MSMTHSDRPGKSPPDDPPPDWLTAADLVALGYDADLVARLPVTHTGHDGGPCWHAAELPDLPAQAAREVRP